MMKILILDRTHPALAEGLQVLGCKIDTDTESSKEEIEEKLSQYDGVVVHSRFALDKQFIDAGRNLCFIARVGAGMETIDCEYAASKGISLISAPEGNRQIVGEQTVGMLLMLLNNLLRADHEVRQGIWIREGNRGYEIHGKTIGIIGYGNMGGAFARCLSGFGCRVIAYDIKAEEAIPYGDEFAEEASLETLFEQADVVSIHTPLTPLTKDMADYAFFKSFKKPIYFLNTSRGLVAVLADLARALEEGVIKGAAIDVQQTEGKNYEKMFREGTVPESVKYLIGSDRVVLSPHIAGWSFEGDRRMAEVIVKKVRKRFY